MSPARRRRDEGPLLRARVAVPLAVIGLVAVALLVARWRVLDAGDPFGPLRPAPPPDEIGDGGGEVVRWAYDGGLAYYLDGDYDEAAAMFSRASAGLPRDPIPAFYGGVSHLMCRRPDAAEVLLREAVAQRPEEALYRYYLAWALHLDDRDDEAAAELARASEGEGRWARRAGQVGDRMR